MTNGLAQARNRQTGTDCPHCAPGGIIDYSHREQWANVDRMGTSPLDIAWNHRPDGRLA
jgi:hypothetical protein